jgi:glycosyltransferase involved in cell wall biosynthesis
MKKLAIITTHPIQYNAPWFKLLQEGGRVEPKVFYTWGQLETGEKYDPGFGKTVQWDIPLLEGYQYTFVNNIATYPGSHHRNGIINPTLNAAIEQWQPDAVLVFGWNFVSHFNCIKYFHKKIPVIFRGDSTLLRKQSLIKAVLRKLYLKWVYSFIDHALYAGTENKKYFLQYGLKENQLIFAPHAVDNERFADRNSLHQTKANEWKKTMGLAADTLTILYAGKLEKIKDPLLIIQFANRFIGQPVNFIIAGNGSLEKELKKMAAGNPQIHFIDFQNQQKMPVVYRLADFFILSSVSETWALGINEAMACGRAVIVRNTCGCAVDLVQNEKNGFVFDADAIDLLYDHITAIISNKEQLQKMGLVSEKIIASYSFKNIVSAIENYFDKK